MLNIPSEVKALFKADSVFKNFHVHFPNGETTDLNNDNIVSESVEFTESLCSQQSFRFGLTEASEIQFTAVGIPNVRGATIECAIEICVDDLGAEWLANNAPTGSEDFLDPQVCTYGGRNMYRVPYGRFIVDKCPRNHEGMWKREVTAYTEKMADENTNPIQTGLLNFYVNRNTYTTNIKPYVLSLLYKDDASKLLELGYTKTAVEPWTQSYIPTTLTLTKTDGTTLTVEFRTEVDSYQLYDAHLIRTDMFGLNWVSDEETDVIGNTVAILESMEIDPVQSGYASLEELADAGLRGLKTPFVHFNNGMSNYAPVPKGVEVFYPWFEGGGNAVLYANPTAVSVRSPSPSSTEYGRFNYNSNVTLDKYSDSNATSALSTAKVVFNSTLETVNKNVSGKVVKVYAFSNAFSFSDLVSGYLELLCQFGSPKRTGGTETTVLDNTTSTPVLPSEYASLWYDETTIAPIGNIRVKFKDEAGTEQDLTVKIGDGASVYDLSDNEVLKNMAFTVSKSEAEGGTTIESKLLAFLNSVFTPNIPDLSFVPIELEKKGLPYFEAGDAVTITTGDGQTVPSFILRQTIKGIQFLQADVESANGEAVELIES